MGRGFFLCVFVVLAGMLSGCAVGPDFQRPDAPKNATYSSSGLPGKTAHADTRNGQAQVFRRVQKVRVDWYELFESPQLNRLIKQALANNPSIQAGQQRLKAARENLKAAKGGLYPQIDAGGGYSRQHKSGTQFGIDDPLFTNVFNLYQGKLSLSYHLDLFGKVQRRIESKTAQMHYQQYRLLGTYLQLVNNVVATSLAEAGINATIDSVRKLADAQRKTLQLLRREVKYGAANRNQVLHAQAQLAATLARLPALKKQQAIARNRLAVLSGQSPGQFHDPDFKLSDFTLPSDLPVTLPSRLIRQRPDILAGQSLMHAASANIGVAKAQLLPDFTLSASYARAALAPSGLFDPASQLWDFGAALMAPLFHGGTLRAHSQAAVDLYKATAEDYRGTVLKALGEVSTNLAALQSDAQGLKAQVQARQSAKDSLDLVRKSYKVGAASYLSLYTAQEQYQRALVPYVQARLQRFQDTAALFRSLGGGWWQPRQLGNVSGVSGRASVQDAGQASGQASGKSS